MSDASRIGASVLSGPQRYGTVGILTQISRGWNLTRIHRKQAVLLMMGPVFLMVVSSILSSLPTLLTSMLLEGEDGLMRVAISLVCMLLSMVLGLVGWLGIGLAFTLLAVVFYHSLTTEAPLPAHWIKQFVKERWTAVSVVFLLLIVLNAGFFIAELVTFFGGVFTAGGLMYAVSLVSELNSKAGAGVVALIVGFVTVVLLYVEFVMQMLCSLFPIIAVAVSPPEKGLLNRAVSSLGLLLHRPHRTMMFGTAILFFYVFMVLFLHLPLYVWMGFEMSHMKPGSFQNGVLPMHMYVVIHLWSMLVSGVAWTFLLGAITLYFYDCQVNAEALDLRVRLDAFKRRWRRGGAVLQGA